MRIRIQPLSIPQDSCETQLRALIEENYVKHNVAYRDMEVLLLLLDLAIPYSSLATTKRGLVTMYFQTDWNTQISLRN